jgi:hypothetical protein
MMMVGNDVVGAVLDIGVETENILNYIKHCYLDILIDIL